MDDGIYRMSVTECCLILIVLALWLFAVLNLARKLEQIWNPPSFQPRFSARAAVISNPSIRHDHSSTPWNETNATSASNLVRATSEPTIEPSTPRRAMLLRSPSEICLPIRLSISQHRSSPSTLELGKISEERSASPENPTPTITTNFLYPRRLPSIIRRSLLDLHRRALYAQNSPESPTKIPLVTRQYQRANAIDDDNWQRSQ